MQKAIGSQLTMIYSRCEACERAYRARRSGNARPSDTTRHGQIGSYFRRGSTSNVENVGGYDTRPPAVEALEPHESWLTSKWDIYDSCCVAGVLAKLELPRAHTRPATAVCSSQHEEPPPVLLAPITIGQGSTQDSVGTAFRCQRTTPARAKARAADASCWRAARSCHRSCAAAPWSGGACGRAA